MIEVLDWKKRRNRRDAGIQTNALLSDDHVENRVIAILTKRKATAGRFVRRNIPGKKQYAALDTMEYPEYIARLKKVKTQFLLSFELRSHR